MTVEEIGIYTVADLELERGLDETLEQIRDEGVVGAPVLAVEILSPSTRRRDLVTKREILQRHGCAHYWVLDPDEVSLRAWRLVDGRYQLHVQAAGDQEVRLFEPAKLTLRVADLLPPRR
ncbi:Uma2 family endonuclease [Ornithinimicrobium faecis]|uniref:Uma2 family endonuclease n=1 Tax=Ornithinimicrobium faecis TaxID=2934158 RepID=A0ABY4YUX7_9MICO|nr:MULTISPECIES: Uma2 family endonuclease [unclassified Ornithinimicrobium]USQ80402.1 Uma2 family endonuclease [Ornithinimicrobium sp. HY1793]